MSVSCSATQDKDASCLHECGVVEECICLCNRGMLLCRWWM